MKKTVFGISMVVLAGLAGQVAAQEEVEPTPVPAAAPTQAAPSSIERIKEKLAEMNAVSTPGLEGVVKMYQAGVDKSVIETYIKNSKMTSPTPRDLIYLHDQGIPQEIVNTLIERGRTVDEEAAKNTPSMPMSAAPAYNPYVPYNADTYNNIVYNNSPETMAAPDQNYDYADYPNNNLLIIPYNPYRSYGSYYSPPFYSWGGAYWPYSSWAWDNCFYGGSYIYPNRGYYGGLRGYYNGSYGRGPIIIGGGGRGGHFGGGATVRVGGGGTTVRVGAGAGARGGGMPGGRGGGRR